MKLIEGGAEGMYVAGGGGGGIFWPEPVCRYECQCTHGEGTKHQYFDDCISGGPSSYNPSCGSGYQTCKLAGVY